MPLSGTFPEAKYSKASEELRTEIESFAKEKGCYPAAKKYADKLGMSWGGLYHTLKRKLEKEGLPTAGFKAGVPVKRAAKLTHEEKEFLTDLRSGKKDISEIARIVAVKVFEKMLRYPDDFKFYDFYQSQLLKLKKEEQDTKNTIAQELINRLFAGQLPPTHCPKCGTEIIKISDVKMVEEGKIIE